MIILILIDYLHLNQFMKGVILEIMVLIFYNKIIKNFKSLLLCMIFIKWIQVLKI